MHTLLVLIHKQGKNMKIKTITAALLIAASTSNVFAQELDITVTNLTQGMYYTPFLVAAHNADMSIFSLGDEASSELQMMAEGGDLSGLSAMMVNANADMVENPAGGLLIPSMSFTTSLETQDDNMYLSLVSMLLPTNDAFVGVNGWMIPSEPGIYTFTLSAYDAGTEANDEIRGGGAPDTPGMPVPPPLDPLLGVNGTGVSMTSEGFIHVHRGNLGDDDAVAGKSDVGNTVQRWLNPVARVSVTVN